MNGKDIFIGTVTFSVLISLGCYAASNLDSTIIGAVTPAAGTFTNLQFTGAESDRSYTTVAPVSGATVTISNNSSTLIVRPSVALAALTITMPALPVDGQIERFVSKVTITSLTVSANSGQNMDGTQPYTLNPGVGAEFIYVASGSIWTRLY